MRDVFFVSCGGFEVPAMTIRPFGEGGLERARMTNTVAVVIRDEGDVVLVDAGWDAATCEDPRRQLGRVRSAVMGVRLTAADAVATQLRKLGIGADRVRAVIATHLHPGHVAGVADFPNAEVIVSKRELEAAGRRAKALPSSARLRTVALDGTPTYGFHGSADPFGNGEVVLLDAQGHTAGSVAVALRGPRGTFVHVGDAVLQQWEFGSPGGPCLVARRPSARRADLDRTYESLRRCEVDPRRPVIVPSHDAAVFDRLPQTPYAQLS
jgi:glyoxylase-like metal-dependent hydrolase (beta-lactamase superfamily II)